MVSGDVVFGNFLDPLIDGNFIDKVQPQRQYAVHVGDDWRGFVGEDDVFLVV